MLENKKTDAYVENSFHGAIKSQMIARFAFIRIDPTAIA